jgi:4-hydroxybenzoate polyprenyltransferase
MDMLLAVFVCFAGLCFVASGIYAVNDIADCEKDKLHPKNKARPVAAGEISKGAAGVFAFILICAGLSLIFFFGGCFGIYYALLYIFLNIAYSLRLKHHAVIDCFCIAAGFVLRVFLGGAAINTALSEWLFLTVVAVSLFLAFGKRRGEFLHLGENGRKVLAGYTHDFLNGIVFSCAGVSIIFYALWAMSHESQMLFTVPIVIFIVCKYLLSAENSLGDPISIIFSDKILFTSIAFFGIISFVFLYF